jgi:hypothetical protein
VVSDVSVENEVQVVTSSISKKMPAQSFESACRSMIAYLCS